MTEGFKGLLSFKQDLPKTFREIYKSIRREKHAYHLSGSTLLMQGLCYRDLCLLSTQLQGVADP